MSTGSSPGMLFIGLKSRCFQPHVPQGFASTAAKHKNVAEKNWNLPMWSNRTHNCQYLDLRYLSKHLDRFVCQFLKPAMWNICLRIFCEKMFVNSRNRHVSLNRGCSIADRIIDVLSWMQMSTFPFILNDVVCCWYFPISCLPTPCCHATPQTTTDYHTLYLKGCRKLKRMDRKRKSKD